MKKIILLLSIYILIQGIQVTACNASFASQYEETHSDIQVKYPDSFLNGWKQYIGQNVVFTQKLYLCGQYGKTLYLAYERLRDPGEYATIGTSDYETIKLQHEQALISATGSGLDLTVRQGGYTENLRARITGNQTIEVLNASQINWNDNNRPTQRPDVGDATLIVCGANLENYFTMTGGFGARTQEEYERQHTKIIKALMNIDADIYALAELEEGNAAIQALVNGLNQSTTSGRYSYVDDGNTEIGTYSKIGYIYRTDKVTPALNLGQPDPTSVIYSKRQYVQAFDENATDERFILSMNHFKAQSTDENGNESTGHTRLANAQNLTNFLSQQLSANYYKDPDILIMGDLNSYTRDYPIIHLVESGYINELEKYDKEGYSHAFRDQVGRLDHALASQSLDSQITGAAVYHLNVDEYFRNGYKYTDDLSCSMYAYSDHDPVIVGLKLNTDTDVSNSIHFYEPFDTSLGDFWYSNIAGSNKWIINTTQACAQMSGYNSGENEDWLISPAFNLTGMQKATLRFEHTSKYGKIENQEDLHTLWVSKNYEDRTLATTAEWTQIKIPNYPSGINYDFVSSGEIILPEEFLTTNVHFAFKYTSPETQVDATTWRIRNVEFKTISGESSKTASNFASPLYKVYGNEGNIIIQNARDTSISIYNLMGQCIARNKSSLNVKNGIYLVCINNEKYKVIVK